MTTIFNITIAKEGARYVATCIDNHVASQGKTMDEAIANLKEALELYYENAEEEFVLEPTNIFLSTLKIDLP